MSELILERDGLRKAEWWGGWELEDPRPSRKPTRALVEWAIERWGDPPPEWEDYVRQVREGDSPRGAGAPRLDVAGLRTHTAYAEAVVVLMVRDGLSLRRSFARAAQHFGVTQQTIKKHWYGENQAVRQKDSSFWPWLRECTEDSRPPRAHPACRSGHLVVSRTTTPPAPLRFLRHRVVAHPISPEMDPDPAPTDEDQRGSEPVEPVDPDVTLFREELARRQGIR